MKLEDLIKKKPEEKIVFFLRRHPIIFIGHSLFIVLLGLIPPALWLLLAPEFEPGSPWLAIVILSASAFYLSIWTVFLTQFVDYYLDAWIVTDDRIVNVEQEGLFARTISELDLAQVQDVTSDAKGVLPTMFGYGEVYIQTAGEKQRFVFEQVPRPHDIRKNLLDLVEVDRRRQGESNPQ